MAGAALSAISPSLHAADARSSAFVDFKLSISLARSLWESAEMFAPDPITRIVAAEPMTKQKSSNIIAELFIIISFDRQVDQLSSKCDRWYRRRCLEGFG
jgi:hypothetical protein